MTNLILEEETILQTLQQPTEHPGGGEEGARVEHLADTYNFSHGGKVLPLEKNLQELSSDPFVVFNLISLLKFCNKIVRNERKIVSTGGCEE